MKRKEGENPRVAGDRAVMTFVIGYSVANVAGIALAATGVFHPPWTILWFFTLVAPCIAGSIIIAMRCWEPEPRPSRAAVSVALVWVALLALFSFWCLASAAAAV